MNRHRMPCRISDSTPYAELTGPYQPDEDEAFERLKCEELDEQHKLSRDLGIAINRLATRNCYDTQDLIRLLKRARAHVG